MAESRWSTARALAKQGASAAALQELTEAIRRSELDSLQLERAGALARKLIDPAAVKSYRIAVLGECTTQWLTNTLVGVALGERKQLCVYEGEYDNVVQEVRGDALREFNPNVVVLLPWFKPTAELGLLSERGEHWHAVQRAVVDRLGAAIVQIGFDWIDPGPEGYQLATGPGGRVTALRRANELLREGLPAGSYFVDLPAVSGDLGRRAFYDPRRYNWTRQPFSEAGIEWLASHVWAGVRALVTGPKKILALDLDNTLWGGVVGEVGPDGIDAGESTAGEGHRALQRYAKKLRSRGILLTVASKNNESDAKAPFSSNTDMELALEDFASFDANWQPKSESLLRAAQQLKLGSDSVVFFDDNPTEREEVRQRAVEVCVSAAAADPAEYTRILTRELWFEAAALTAEDAARAEQYRVEAQREGHKGEHGSLEDYLASLALRADVRDVDEADMKRVVQLIGKTNQFNVTTPRYSRAELESILAEPGAFGLTLRLRDRFGDYGLILLTIGRPSERATLEIDTFLMSCRAIARSVEEFAWGKVIERAQRLGYERIVACYRKTAKNELVADLFSRLGLEPLGGDEHEQRYQLLLASASPPTTFVRDAE